MFHLSWPSNHRRQLARNFATIRITSEILTVGSLMKGSFRQFARRKIKGWHIPPMIPQSLA